MNIHPNCRIELATSKDKEFLSEPYFTGKELVATDSFILAVVRVEDAQDDTPGYVSGAFLKRLRAGRWSDKVRLNANGDLNGDHKKEGGIKMERPLKDFEFPNWKEAVPGERREAKVALNPELLLKLSQAIGLEESVILHFPLDGEGRIMPNEKILVTPNDWKENQGNYGVIMPCRMKESLQEEQESETQDMVKDAGEVPVILEETELAEEIEPAHNPEGETGELEKPEIEQETESGESEEPETPPGEEPEGWVESSHTPEPEDDDLESEPGGVWQGVELPGVKKVRYESALGSRYAQRTITKVYFKDATVVTLAGALSRAEAVVNAYYQKGKYSGMTVEDAAVFAGKAQAEPLKGEG